MNDLSLLRKFEPVIKYTQGELFFPCAVDEYVKQCSLWMRDEEGLAHNLVPAGQLTLEKLAEHRETPEGQTLYLRFAPEPMGPLDYQRWLHRPDRPIFRAPGRLARVGLIARITDSLFDLSLILRGTVPGGTTAAADVQYRQMQQKDPRNVYYGRVLRRGGYIILHYLFFFAMNDWRSSFHGINDHESDWEQVFIFLTENEGEPTPRWAAYASHDFKGDDLRRRWDDPELILVDGTHPLIFAGAGSHASYFEQGEYLMSASPRFLQPVMGVIAYLRKFWVEQLGQGRNERVDRKIEASVSVPFVDYARGDGMSIGPGQQHQWTPILISDEDGWVDGYRGLWGLDTKDPFGGERAPSGPKYNRDGSVRLAWYNPLGWASLDKVAPPNQTLRCLDTRIARLEEDRRDLETQIAQAREELRLLALEVQSLQQTNYFSALHTQRLEDLSAKQEHLRSLQSNRLANAETRRAAIAYRRRIEQGDWGDPQAHIKRAHHPEPPTPPQARIVELWAAISGALLLLALVAVLTLLPHNWPLWLLGIGVIFGAIESTVRGHLFSYLLNLTIILALITSAILLWKFWWVLLGLSILGMVIFMIRENLREIWQS